MSTSVSNYFAKVNLKWKRDLIRTDQSYSYLITNEGVAAEPPIRIKTFESLFEEFGKAQYKGKTRKALRTATVVTLALNGLCRASAAQCDFTARADKKGSEEGREIVFAKVMDRRTLNKFIMNFDRTLNGFFPPFAGINPRGREVRKLQKDLLFYNTPLGFSDKTLPPPQNELPNLLCQWFAVGGFYQESTRRATNPLATYVALPSHPIADALVQAMSPIAAMPVVELVPPLAHSGATAAPALSGAGAPPLEAAPVAIPVPALSGSGAPPPAAAPAVMPAPALSGAGAPPPVAAPPHIEAESPTSTHFWETLVPYAKDYGPGTATFLLGLVPVVGPVLSAGASASVEVYQHGMSLRVAKSFAVSVGTGYLVPHAAGPMLKKIASSGLLAIAPIQWVPGSGWVTGLIERSLSEEGIIKIVATNTAPGTHILDKVYQAMQTQLPDALVPGLRRTVQKGSGAAAFLISKFFKKEEPRR